MIKVVSEKVSELENILPQEVDADKKSYISGLIETAIDRRGETDLATLLKSVKTQALRTWKKPSDGQIAYCLRIMMTDGKIVCRENTMYSLTYEPPCLDFRVGGTSSED